MTLPLPFIFRRFSGTELLRRVYLKVLQFLAGSWTRKKAASVCSLDDVTGRYFFVNLVDHETAFNYSSHTTLKFRVQVLDDSL